MANLVINTFCNLRCPYCFAEDEKAVYVNEEMNMDTVKQAVEFITRTEGRVGVIGGEPTFHSRFREIMYYLFDNPKVTSITLYTNGTNLAKYKDILINPKVGMLINLNANGICSDQKVAEIVRDAKEIVDGKALRGLYGQVNLGINIYSPEQKIDYIFDAATTLGVNRLRFSTSIQQFELNNTPNPLEYFRKMKSKLIEFFDKCLRNGIIAGEDCNFIPWCILTDEEREKYNTGFANLAQQYGTDFQPLGANNACLSGGHPIDIHPDLTLSRCFGMSEYTKTPVTMFRNLNDVHAYFRNQYDAPSMMLHMSSECDSKCENYLACSGSCLKYKLNGIMDIKSKLESR